MVKRRKKVRRARLDAAGTAKPRTTLIGHFLRGKLIAPGRAIRYELRDVPVKRRRRVKHAQMR